MCKTVAQAFHWFDRDRFKAECQRILKLDGSVVLLWNSTDNNSPINIEIANINRRLCEKFDGYSSRNDYPVRAMFNLIIALKVYGHRNVESFRRELSRNAGLRQICGLKDYEHKYYGKHLVPEPRVFTNFLKGLINYQNELDKIFEGLVEYMYDNIKGFGEDAAIDGKIIRHMEKRIMIKPKI